VDNWVFGLKFNSDKEAFPSSKGIHAIPYVLQAAPTDRPLMLSEPLTNLPGHCRVVGLHEGTVIDRFYHRVESLLEFLFLGKRGPRMFQVSPAFTQKLLEKTQRKSPPAYSLALVTSLLLGAADYAEAAPPATGANKFLGNITSRGQVRSDFGDYWNQITGENEHKWSSVEGTRDRMNWTGGDRVANYAKTAGIMWKFHTLVWGSQFPGWISGLSQADQLAEVEEWFDASKAQYPDLPMIDVVNEAHPNHAPPPFKNALGGDGSTGYDWIIKAFRMARERWPKAILIYNDYNNIEYNNEVTWTVNLVNAMIKAGAPIDAIGCQAHDAYKINTNTLKSNIDKLAATGLPIFITEYDIGHSDDTQQLNSIKDQFPMFWNHPSIVGVTYWGYIVGETWRTGTGLKQSNGTERPSLTWLKGYVKDNLTPSNKFASFLSTGGTSIGKNLFKQDLNRNSSALRNPSASLKIFDLQGRVVGGFSGSESVSDKVRKNSLPILISE
jgi:endo-1,4-beta-xylanase